MSAAPSSSFPPRSRAITTPSNRYAMNLLLVQECTRALDPVIAEERVRHASERVDFHEYFPRITISQLQARLRGGRPTIDDGRSRGDLLNALLVAQLESPHRLWELLILQVAESKLVKRRQRLGAPDDARIDALVVETFLDALQDLSVFLRGSGGLSYAMRISGKTVRRKLREERGDPVRERWDAKRAAWKARAMSGAGSADVAEGKAS